MADECVLETGRGAYSLKLAAAPEVSEERLILPLVLEHRGGLERVGLICRLRRRAAGAYNDAFSALESGTRNSSAHGELLRLIAARFKRDFEQLREAALKSIRTERKLLQLDLDEAEIKPNKGQC